MSVKSNAKRLDQRNSSGIRTWGKNWNRLWKKYMRHSSRLTFLPRRRGSSSSSSTFGMRRGKRLSKNGGDTRSYIKLDQHVWACARVRIVTSSSSSLQEILVAHTKHAQHAYTSTYFSLQRHTFVFFFPPRFFTSRTILYSYVKKSYTESSCISRERRDSRDILRTWYFACDHFR